jgi:hypothetical protein
MRTIVAALFLLAACSPGTPIAVVPGSLVGLAVSDAEVGKQGRLRIELENPAGSITEVTLVAAVPAVAKLPDKVTIPQGALTAEVSYDAASLGTTSVSATLGDATVTGVATVVDHFGFAAYGDSSTALEVGATSNLPVYLSGTTPAALTVAVAPADGSVVSAPTSITIAPFRASGAVTVTAVAPGATSLVFSLDDQKHLHPVTVVDQARLMYVSTSQVLGYETVGTLREPVQVQVGGPSFIGSSPTWQIFETGTSLQILLQLDAVVAQPRTLTAASSNPSVAPVSASPVVAVGEQSATVDMTLAGSGDAQLSFSLGDSTLVEALCSRASAQISSLSISSLAPAQTGQLTVTLDLTAATAHTVVLSSSDPSVLAVPAQVVIAAGADSAMLAVTPLKAGTTVLTAKLGDSSQAIAAVVGAQAQSLTLSAAQDLAVGASTSLSISDASTPVVTLSSSNPGVVAVQPSIVVQSTYAYAPLTALAPGVATITATSGTQSQTIDVTVVAAARISFYGASYHLDVGESESEEVDLSAVAPLGAQLTFSSSDPSVIAAPPAASFDWEPDRASFVLKGLSSGTAILTATLGSASRSVVVYVGAASSATTTTLSQCSLEDSTLQVGSSTYARVRFTSSASSDIPVAVTFSTPGIVSIPDTVVLPSGQSEVDFPVEAVAAGTTDVIVAAGGISQRDTVTVVTEPTFKLSAPSTVAIGGSIDATLSSNCILPRDATFTVSSSAAAVATTSVSSLTLPPGSTAPVSFSVSGVAAGTATIRATLGTATLTTDVAVGP